MSPIALIIVHVPPYLPTLQHQNRLGTYLLYTVLRKEFDQLCKLDRNTLPSQLYHTGRASGYLPIDITRAVTVLGGQAGTQAMSGRAPPPKREECIHSHLFDCQTQLGPLSLVPNTYKGTCLSWGPAHRSAHKQATHTGTLHCPQCTAYHGVILLMRP